jgi:dipeptidyl-peptidase-4
MPVRVALAASFLLAIVPPVNAAPPPPQALTLERIFASPALSGPTPRALKLSPDGRFATLLRNRPDDLLRYDLWAIDTASGAERMLVDSKKAGSGEALSEAEKMRRERARLSGITGIVDYQWAPDGKTLLVPIDGDLYLASLDGTIRRLSKTKAGESDPQVSPKGRSVSFVRDQNLHLIDLASGAERALTSDGGGTLSWGTAEFVAQEELARTQGTWWAPDDSRLAVERLDESKVAIVPRAAIDADGTRVFEQRYPKAGTDNATVDLYVMRADGSGRVKADLGADPDFYLARVDWAKDGRTLYVQRLSRDQKRLDLLAVDPENGQSHILFSESAATWVNLLDNNLWPLGDGSLLWASERDGFMHLYHWQGGRWTQLTEGQWAVARIAGVDEARGLAYVLGNRDGPLEQHLYAVNIAHPGAPVRLTEAGWYNDAVMDKSGARMLVTRSSPAQPRQVYLADATGKRIEWISENAITADDHPFAPYRAAHPLPTFGTLKAADGQTLHYSLLSPKREAGKRYPVFVRVYGGPRGPLVKRAWGSAIDDYLVAKGWIVFSLDNRGTSFRGTAFDAPIYHALGGVEVADQLAGVAWLKAQPFVDPARVAVMGWSYGGYMTLKLLEAAPGTFAAGVAVAPVTKWELYDTAYTERYLGDPRKVPEVYAKADVLADADKIADPLMLIHGMADDNVVFENSTALYARLQEARRPFEMMVYPGKTHAIAGLDTSIHLWTTIENFLDRRVLAPK